MAKSKEMLTFWMFFIAFVVTIGLSLLDYFVFKLVYFPEWLIAISLAILVLSYLLRSYLRAILGSHFNINIVIRKDHKLITKGPYKYLRHPMYTSSIFIFLGLAGVLSSVLGIISTIVLIIPTILIRINKEEFYLIKKLGKEYRDYIKQTKKLIPFIY